MEAVYNGFAPFYDLEYGDKQDDLDFYLDVAGQIGSPILEIGAGTGRVTLPLVNEGHTVFGIDNSEKMLAVAEKKRLALSREQQSRVEFSLQDMRNFHLDKTFSLCIMPFRTFLHNLDTDEQVATLDCIYEHLGPNGILAFDLFVPLYNMLSRSEWEESFTADEMAGPESDINVKVRVEHDSAEQLLSIDNHYQSTTTDVHHKMRYRYVFRYEMELLLNITGFRVEQVYGGFEGQKYDFNSGVMIFTASKQPDVH